MNIYKFEVTLVVEEEEYYTSVILAENIVCSRNFECSPVKKQKVGSFHKYNCYTVF